MTHAQKSDFVFRRNGRVHLNRRGSSVQSTTGSRGVRISGSSAGYTMFRGFVKGTGYPLHSPVSPSLPLPCVTVCRHVSTGLLPIVCCVCVYRIFHHELVVRCFYMYCTQLLHVSAIYIYMRLSFTQYTSTKLVTLWRWPRKCSDGAAESFTFCLVKGFVTKVRKILKSWFNP